LLSSLWFRAGAFGGSRTRICDNLHAIKESFALALGQNVENLLLQFECDHAGFLEDPPALRAKTNAVRTSI
jgi:hypothetical protein